MAPKAASKAKNVKAEPSTPQPKVKPEAVDTPKKTPATSSRKPRVAPPPRVYTNLSVEGEAAPVQVKFEGSQQALAVPAGGYRMELKLGAPNTFTVIKTTVLTEGPFQGHQAIIIRPAKPFKFMALPEIVRNAVYRMYFAPKGLTDSTTPIVLDGKRTIDKTPYSKSYADGSKTRVGLLAVSKEVYAEAAAVLYNHPLRFESTGLLGEFLIENRSTRLKICNVEVKNFKKTGSRGALTLLAECTSLRRLRFELGITNDPDPRKAAKAFYLEAAQLLDSIGKQKQDKDAGVDMIEFAKGALTNKGDKIKAYSEDQVAEFIESLKKLCK